MKNDYDPNFVATKTFYLVGGKILIFNKDGKVLILLRSKKSSGGGMWAFPGGALEDGEDAYSGIKREILEETDLTLTTDITPFAVATFYNTDKDPTVVVGYYGKYKTGEVKLNWEHDEYKWVTLDNIQKMKITSGTRFFVEKYIELKNRK